jgi:electron transport complex protein RnfB
VPACELCSTTCVLPLSAVRAVNDHAKCGRCYICPAYFEIKSAVNAQGLPSQKLCPRDAIKREAIGDIDPTDPANNYYEYVIDEQLCYGCGKCVMGCKEPAGLSSIRLEVRHNLCVDCNRCSIAIACPDEAYERVPVKSGTGGGAAPSCCFCCSRPPRPWRRSTIARLTPHQVPKTLALTT